MRDYYQSAIDTLRDLVQMDTVEAAPEAGAPCGAGVRRALDYTLALLSGWGFATRDLDGYCGWAEIGEGDLFGVLAHLDTVPLGEGWRYDPLSATIADGKMFGRGTQDDKGPLVASMYALKSLLDEGKTPKKRVRFILGCNEETGWQCMDRYLATEEIPAMAISPDGDFPVINCEKGLGHFELRLACPSLLVSLESGDRVNVVPSAARATVSVCTDEMRRLAQDKGVRIQPIGAQYALSATGKSAHGSTPHLGDNALLKVLAVLAEADPALARLYAALCTCDGAGLGIALSDAVSGALTMNVGYAHTRDGEMAIGLDIRAPISVTVDTLAARMTEALPEAEVRLDKQHPSLYVSADHPLVADLLAAYRSVTGDLTPPLCVGGATYARALPCAVAFGPVFPGDEEMCHQVDEYVRLDRFAQMIAIYRAAFERICF
jgi:succinyl-diaminopimelate desuccinylase